MKLKSMLVAALFLGMMLMPSIAIGDSADEYTTTGEWNTGTKGDPGDGNYNVETETDNFKYGTGNLTLANMYGDEFTYADVDALTFKWQESNSEVSGGTHSEDIDTTNNDALYMSCGDAGNVGLISIGLKQELTGDFSVQVKLDIDTWPATNTGAIRVMAFDTNNDRMWMERIYTAGTDVLAFKRVIGGVLTTDQIATVDKSISLRIRRVGTTLYGAYDLAQGDTWTEWTKVGGFNTDVEIILRIGSATTNGLRDCHWTEFRINTGTFAGNAFRTAGNWSSPLITQPTGDVLNNITIDLNNSWAGNCIDKIEILNATDDVISTDTTDLTTNGTIIRGWSTFDNGFNGTFENGSFKIKLFLKGPGTATPILQRLNYTTLNYSVIAYIKWDGGTFGDLNDAMLTRAITTYNITLIEKILFRPGEVVYFNGTITLSLAVADAWVNVTVFNDADVIQAVLLNVTWSFAQNIAYNLTEIGTDLLNWTSGGADLYYVNLYVNKTGEINADNDTEYFRITDAPYNLNSTIRSYSENVTTIANLSSLFESTEVIWFNGTITIDTDVANLNLNVSIHNETDWVLDLLSTTTESFSAGIMMNLTEINGGTVLNWPGSVDGQHYVQLLTWKPGEVTSFNVTEDFLVAPVFNKYMDYQMYTTNEVGYLSSYMNTTGRLRFNGTFDSDQPIDGMWINASVFNQTADWQRTLINNMSFNMAANRV